jgi:tetratricopeptide (TPR) repeat protein
LNRSAILVVTLAGVLLAACATTDTSAPPPVAQGDARFLIDPRIGFTGPATEPNGRQFEAAWRFFLQGDDAQAIRRLTALTTKSPEYTPAVLALAAIDIRAGRTAVARDVVQRIADRDPAYTAARVYEAEIAIAEKNTRRAYDIYRGLGAQPGAPATVAERVASLRDALQTELVTAATGAADIEAIRLLRDALELNQNATDARLLLTRKLVGQKNWDEARRTLEPLVNSTELDRPEVQEMLAEIDAGRGRYQEAIVRYDRLARRTKEPRYNTRLEEIKATWSAANMPPQFTAALESPEINRGDLAVLLYWNLSSVRFAQNLSTPPIATDIGDVAGREELIRAIAMGFYDVDPVTRRVGATRTVTASSLTRLLARLLTSRGAECARSASGADATRVLAACGITDPAAGQSPDAPISGRTAAAILDRVEKALAR